MDEKNLELLLDAYVKKQLINQIKCLLESRIKKLFDKQFMSFAAMGTSAISYRLDFDGIDFLNLQAKKKTETFSEMIIRLIAESGEKNSAIYTRANIDRRHFSKIANHKEYQPSKQTALAFAIALKLDIDRTQQLLATAGYTLNNANLADVIVSFFIEYKIFDVDLVNQALYKYKLPLLGG